MPDEMPTLIEQQNRRLSDIVARLPKQPSGFRKFLEDHVLWIVVAIVAVIPLWDMGLRIYSRYQTQNTFNVLISTGDYLLATGHEEEAAEKYREASKLLPGDSNARAKIALANGPSVARKYENMPRELNAEERKEVAAFVADSIQLTKTRPKDAEAFRLLGLSLELDNQLDEAVKAFQTSLRLNAENHVTYNQLGITYKKKRDWKDAVDCFNSAIKFADKRGVAYARAYNNRGLAFVEQQKYKEALDDFETAIHMDKNYASPYVNRGKLFSDLAQRQRQESQAKRQELLALAAKDYWQAIILGPPSADNYYNLATVFLNERRLHVAIDFYNRAEKLDPQDAGIHKNKGAALALLGKHDADAAAEFSLAITLNPQDPENYKNRAIIYRRQGLTEQARVDEEAEATLRELERLQTYHPQQAGGEPSKKKI